MGKRKEPTREELHKLLDYDAATGMFTWKQRDMELFNHLSNPAAVHKSWNVRCAGKAAGNSSDRYVRIRVNGVSHCAHRLAYIYENGNITTEQIDHKNRNAYDNRIENLRLATGTINARNRGTRNDNTSGIVGVTLNKQAGLWIAAIFHGGKNITVGIRKNFDDAVKDRYQAEIKYGYSQYNQDSTAKQYLQEAAQ